MGEILVHGAAGGLYIRLDHAFDVVGVHDAGVNAFDITAGMQCCFELMTPPTCMPKA